MTPWAGPTIAAWIISCMLIGPLSPLKLANEHFFPPQELFELGEPRQASEAAGRDHLLAED